MPIRVPNHPYFWNANDADRYRDASIVAAMCEQFGTTADEAIDFLAAVGRIELFRQNANVIGVPCRQIEELARMHGICPNGDGQ
jgi:hypothetical protein